jgi:hypothetical protein
MYKQKQRTIKVVQTGTKRFFFFSNEIGRFRLQTFTEATNKLDQ